MPEIISISGYKLYFWSDENEEPLHFHVAESKQENGTKIWITSAGKAIVEHNKSKVPDHKLNKILKWAEANVAFIEKKWFGHLGYITYKK